MKRNKRSSPNRKKQIYEESFLQQSQNRKKKKKVFHLPVQKKNPNMHFRKT